MAHKARPQVTIARETLDRLDLGKVAAAFKMHLKRAGEDCLDRPLEKTARKVCLEVSVQPSPDDHGDCERVKVQMRVTSTVPKHKTTTYDLAIRKGGMMVFSEHSPTNFDQSTLFDDDGPDPEA